MNTECSDTPADSEAEIVSSDQTRKDERERNRQSSYLYRYHEVIIVVCGMTTLLSFIAAFYYAGVTFLPTEEITAPINTKHLLAISLCIGLANVFMLILSSYRQSSDSTLEALRTAIIVFCVTVAPITIILFVAYLQSL